MSRNLDSVLEAPRRFARIFDDMKSIFSSFYVSPARTGAAEMGVGGVVGTFEAFRCPPWLHLGRLFVCSRFLDSSLSRALECTPSQDCAHLNPSLLILHRVAVLRRRLSAATHRIVLVYCRGCWECDGGSRVVSPGSSKIREVQGGKLAYCVRCLQESEGEEVTLFAPTCCFPTVLTIDPPVCGTWTHGDLERGQARCDPSFPCQRYLANC